MMDLPDPKMPHEEAPLGRSTDRSPGKPFLLLWASQSLLLLGSSLTRFALGLWAFGQTGKALDFTGLVASSLLPAALLAPWAGTAADQHDKRRIMLAADVLCVLCSGALAGLTWQGLLQLKYLHTINVVDVAARAFHMPAYMALLFGILPQRQVSRAIGLIGMSIGVIEICAPVAATVLMPSVNLRGIVIIELVAASIGIFLLWRTFELSPRPTAMQATPMDTCLLAWPNFVRALLFFETHRLMFCLLSYATLQASLVALAATLITPLVLSNHSSDTLGTIIMAGEFGGLLGAASLSFRDTPGRLMVCLLACEATVSACMFAAGLGHSAGVYATCLFVASAAASAASGFSTALWMCKLPTEQQGCLFALIGMVTMLMAPVAVGGFAADRIFEPALSRGGPLAPTIGAMLSVDKGKGLAMVFVLCGTGGLALSISALASVRLRNVNR
jgi:diaminobutyrate-2-oxoglutarate transaminase